jgi:MFS family permease
MERLADDRRLFVGTGAAAIATGLTGNPITLALRLSAIGLFGSIYHPVCTAWLIRNAANRGRALGWNGISESIGLAAAPFVRRCAGASHFLAHRVHPPRPAGAGAAPGGAAGGVTGVILLIGAPVADRSWDLDFPKVWMGAIACSHRGETEGYFGRLDR